MRGVRVSVRHVCEVQGGTEGVVDAPGGTNGRRGIRKRDQGVFSERDREEHCTGSPGDEPGTDWVEVIQTTRTSRPYFPPFSEYGVTAAQIFFHCELTFKLIDIHRDAVAQHGRTAVAHVFPHHLPKFTVCNRGGPVEFN